MQERRIGRRIERHASIGSTNDRARELLDGADGDGVIVVADEQTAGRGRRGRSWLSPPGRNLYLSAAIVPAIAASEAWRIGLATALAVADACGRVAPVALKWPNDVVAADSGSKLGGLLIETIVEGDRLRGAVLGIGLNVNWRRVEMPIELRGEATSLADLAGTDVDREGLLLSLVDRLSAEIGALEAGISPLERYRARCSTLGSPVTVDTGERALVTGTAIDLDTTASLVVEDASGQRHVVSSGEVQRVRPMVPA